MKSLVMNRLMKTRCPSKAAAGTGGRQDGTRGGEKGEAEANSGMISCLAKPSFPDAIVSVGYRQCCSIIINAGNFSA